jgi:hypothetical protein
VWWDCDEARRTDEQVTYTQNEKQNHGDWVISNNYKRSRIVVKRNPEQIRKEAFRFLRPLTKKYDCDITAWLYTASYTDHSFKIAVRFTPIKRKEKANAKKTK